MTNDAQRPPIGFKRPVPKIQLGESDKSGEEKPRFAASIQGRPDLKFGEVFFMDMGWVRHPPKDFRCRFRLQAESRGVYARWVEALCVDDRLVTIKEVTKEGTPVTDPVLFVSGQEDFFMTECSNRSMVFILDSVSLVRTPA